MSLKWSVFEGHLVHTEMRRCIESAYSATTTIGETGVTIPDDLAIWQGCLQFCNAVVSYQSVIKVQELEMSQGLQPLQAVVEVCRQARTLSEAGRKLFDRSRTQRTVVNDADRLRKYLQKYGLSWDQLNAPSGS